MSEQQDQIFFRNYSIVIGLLALMIIIFLLAARFIGIDDAVYIEQRAEQIAERTAPVGKLRIEGEAPAAGETVAIADGTADSAMAAVEVSSGKQVYSGLCFSCHGTGLPGIPQFGDAAAWAPRIAQGKELLYERSILGFTGASGIMMPARGGNPALSDAEVMAAVDYMVENSQ